jgi:hypothetical protein
VHCGSFAKKFLEMKNLGRLVGFSLKYLWIHGYFPSSVGMRGIRALPHGCPEDPGQPLALGR